MTGFAVASEFNALRAKQNVCAFAVKRFAGGISVERLAPSGMRICVAGSAAGSRKELLDRNQTAALCSSIRGSEVSRRVSHHRLIFATCAIGLCQPGANPYEADAKKYENRC